MAGIVKVNTVQLGDSATATQNFVLRTNVDGTATLARGNAGATSQDILTIDALGRVSLPNQIMAVSAFPAVAQSLVSGAATKIVFATEEFDYGATFDGTKFLPGVPGIYAMVNSVALASAATANTFFYKNGLVYKTGISTTNGLCGLALSTVYLNGTSDYIETWALQTGATQNTNPSVGYTYFQASLISRV